MQEFLNWATMRLGEMGFGAYWLLALIVYLETLIIIGQFVPGGVILAFAGFLCYLQVFDFGNMLFAIFLAHYLGEITNYTLGRVKGRSLFREDSRWLKPSLLESAEKRFAAGGIKIIFISQFTGFFRSVIPLTAGMTRYPLWRFLPAIAAAAFVWALTHLGIGYLFGASWKQAVRYLEGLSLFVLVAVAAFVISGWLIRRLAEHAGEFAIWTEATGRAIRRSEHYQAIARRSPRLFRFLEGRLSLSRPWGMTATVGWITTAVLLILFAAILHDVNEQDTWRHFDLSIVNLLAQLRRPAADKLFLFITILGNSPVVIFVVLMSGAMCLRARQAKSAIVIIGSVLLAIALSQLIKVVYARSRPEAALAMIRARGFSFPSGHATVAVALFGALYYWLWNHPGRVRLRMFLAFVVLTMVLLIGFSRLYLGVHFPSDVVAGFFLGSAVVVFMTTIVRNISRLPDLQRRADIRALVVIVAQLLFATYFYQQHPSPPRARVYRPDQYQAIDTTATLVQRVPREVRGLTGHLSFPTDMVMVGDPKPLVDRLLAAGWKHIEPDDFMTKQINAPVFPAFLDGVPARLTLERGTTSSRMLLRIWRSNYVLDGDPTWVASVAGEVRRPKLLGFSVFRTSPDLDATMNEFAAGLEGLKVQEISFFRKRDLYAWKRPFFTHGNGLFLDLTGTTSTLEQE